MAIEMTRRIECLMRILGKFTGGRQMGTKKLVAGVTLVALLGSDLGFGVVAALGQTTGNGSMPVPSLTDGALGSVAPGTPAPYQQQQQQLQLQPQPIPQRQ